MMKFFLGAITAVVLSLVARPASAYPWMIRHAYTQCSTCHADPVGGGANIARCRTRKARTEGRRGDDAPPCSRLGHPLPARRRPRPNHSTALRANVAFAALTSDATTAALASRCDVHAHQVTQSKPQLVAQASAVFSSDGVRTDAAPGVDVKALHAMIGQQALEIVSGSLG